MLNSNNEKKVINLFKADVFDPRTTLLTKLYDPKTDPKEIEAIIAYLESKPEQDKNDFERYTIKLIREGRLEEFLNSKPVINRTPTFAERTIDAISKLFEECYTNKKQLCTQ
jgi:hypothetical protein